MNAQVENMLQETKVDCETTIEKVKHRSAVTIDWSGMTPRDLQEIAEGRIIIRFQDENRRLGNVPEKEITLKAVDFKVGTRRARVTMTPEQALAALTPEQLQALLAAKGLA